MSSRTVSREALLLLGLSLALVVIAVAGYFFLKHGKAPTPVETVSFDLRGEVLLTLAPATREGERIRHEGLYSLNLETKTLKPFFVDDNLSHIMGKFSPRPGTTAITSNMSLDGDYSGKTSDMFQVYLLHNTNPKIEQLTSSPSLSKRAVTWSYAGDKLLFNAVKKRGQSSRPDDWAIYRTDLEGNETYLTDGASPSFSPDDQTFLYLKNDGLYAYHFEGASSMKLLNFQGTGLYNMKFALSKDGSQLALANPNEGTVFLYDVNPWYPVRLSLPRKITAHAFWPVFSPDGKYLLLQEVDWGLSPKNPRLVAYRIEDLEEEEVFDLSAFAQNHIYVTDWR